MTDIEIAHKCALKPISEIAAVAGIDEAYVETYGKYKAKISLDLLRERAAAPGRPKDGNSVGITVFFRTPHCALCAGKAAHRGCWKRR